MARERKQYRLFPKKRAGVVLTKDQVIEIKKGRKKLRKDLKTRGIKSKQEFEMIAGGLGLYFDKRGGLLAWLLHGRALWALLLALLALLLVFFLMSLISQMRGHFTISLNDSMFREGFVLSETADFANPVVNLYCEQFVDVPCISITQIDEDVDRLEGQNNGMYFAYTFYCRNEGENIVDYTWQLEINDESKNLSNAAWIMIFEDGKMCFYAEADEETGLPEALPGFDDDGRGYTDCPLVAHAKYPDDQYEVVREKNGIRFYRVVPMAFESSRIAASGLQQKVAPMDVHKYTVVIWLEGDDPDCDNSKIGGHLGLDMQFKLIEESIEANSGVRKTWWQTLWDNLRNELTSE